MKKVVFGIAAISAVYYYINKKQTEEEQVITDRDNIQPPPVIIQTPYNIQQPIKQYKILDIAPHVKHNLTPNPEDNIHDLAAFEDYCLYSQGYFIRWKNRFFCRKQIFDSYGSFLHFGDIYEFDRNKGIVMKIVEPQATFLKQQIWNGQ